MGSSKSKMLLAAAFATITVPQLAAVSTEFVLRLDRGHKKRLGDFAHG